MYNVFLKFYFLTEEGYMKIYLRGRPIYLYAPSSIEQFDINDPEEPPNEQLQLEYVHGYRGRDARNNLFCLPSGEVIYFTAAIVVMHNLESDKQRHYIGHTDDVKCLAIHPDKVQIASGQVAGHDDHEGKPHVRIWNSQTLETIHVIGLGDFERAVCCVSFSKVDNGHQLVAVDDSNDHSSADPVLAAEFHPTQKNCIVSCGKGQITFWTLEAKKLNKKSGIFGKHDKPKFILSITFSKAGDVYSGDSNGNIFKWAKDPSGSFKITKSATGAHEAGVFFVYMMNDGTILSGGGKDRRIIQWDDSLKPTGAQGEVPEGFGGVRTITEDTDGNIVVGTTRNCLFKGSLEQLKVEVQGHMDELWGLAAHPTEPKFLTAGSDKLNTDPAHSCCIHPNGQVAAIGTETGSWMAMDLTNRNILCTFKDAAEQIECIQYSPDGAYLAAGSRDNGIYVYSVEDDGQKYSKVGKCSGHSSFVTHLDWSTDSKFIVRNVPSCDQETSASDLRDTEWATMSCTLNFNNAGIWPEGADGTDVNGCDRSHNQQLIASADDFGKVNLYRYPCSQPKATGHALRGHSSHVTNVAFLADDSKLISAGGGDMTVLQWTVL
ncbi:hypothetical protein KUTeg_014160 [Tegillarca granosa]|uniref:HELP domain-containing protein n=1 Tax=Tegillarca granosa TaxID=220873 RepID=A0ABQ9EYB1_TEGGR|nr:hypothetical protein KUTeg_014160 [Tegillarca granosa]